VQGDTIRIVFTQRTPHYGRFELRVCPLSDPSLLTEYNELSEACLDAHQLMLAPNSTQASACRGSLKDHSFCGCMTRTRCSSSAMRSAQD